MVAPDDVMAVAVTPEITGRIGVPIVNGAVAVAPAYDAVIVTVAPPELEDVLIVNVALDIPAGTGTVAGTEATVLLLDRLTTIPPAGALKLRKTVPVAEAPAATVPGETPTPANIA
jgi:hypothetical protein